MRSSFSPPKNNQKKLREYVPSQPIPPASHYLSTFHPRNDQAPDLATRHERCPRGTKLHQMTRIWCPWINGQQTQPLVLKKEKNTETIRNWSSSKWKKHGQCFTSNKIETNLLPHPEQPKLKICSKQYTANSAQDSFTKTVSQLKPFPQSRTAVFPLFSGTFFF